MKKISYIPKGTEKDYCEGINLCSVRKDDSGNTKVGLKIINGETKEILLKDVINEDYFNGKEIIRVYSSGHVFLSKDKKEVFLITTEKDGKIQHQFTGGSPTEEENINIISKRDGIYKFDINKVNLNAKIRTRIRTGVKVTEEYNQYDPIVDWVLQENEDNGIVYYKLICLMHFVVKKYEGVLSFTGEENSVGGEWYKIDELNSIENIAPNVFIVTKTTLNEIIF